MISLLYLCKCDVGITSLSVPPGPHLPEKVRVRTLSVPAWPGYGPASRTIIEMTENIKPTIIRHFSKSYRQSQGSMTVGMSEPIFLNKME